MGALDLLGEGIAAGNVCVAWLDLFIRIGIKIQSLWMKKYLLRNCLFRGSSKLQLEIEFLSWVWVQATADLHVSSVWWHFSLSVYIYANLWREIRPHLTCGNCGHKTWPQVTYMSAVTTKLDHRWLTCRLWPLLKLNLELKQINNTSFPTCDLIDSVTYPPPNAPLPWILPHVTFIFDSQILRSVHNIDCNCISILIGPSWNVTTNSIDR